MLDIDDVITSRLQVASVARTAASDGSLYVYDGFLNFLTREELKELSKTETPEQTGREEAYRNPPPLPGLEAAMLVYTHRWWVRTIGTFIYTHTHTHTICNFSILSSISSCLHRCTPFTTSSVSLLCPLSLLSLLLSIYRSRDATTVRLRQTSGEALPGCFPKLVLARTVRSTAARYKDQRVLAGR